jgi:hypothetical protein
MKNLVDELGREKNTCDMWKKFKRLKTSLEEPIPKRPLSKPGTNETTDDAEEKAEIFSSRLESVHQVKNSPGFDDDWKKSVDDFIASNPRKFNPLESPIPEIDDDDIFLKYIDVALIREKLSETKKKSSPGDDSITYDLLRRCPDDVLAKIGDVLNYCLLVGYFPSAWKHAKVVMLPKPHKDHTVPKNYRPISLLSCIGKLFERIICSRLVSILDAKNFFNPFQTGYRKGRSTQEHLFRLTQSIFNGFKQQKCTLAIFLDCESAFDAVWTNGLRYKLFEINLPSKLLRILSSFLDGRSLHVCVDGQESRIIFLRAGTPQGSCISPVIFIIFVNDLPASKKVHSSQYADDIGLWITSSPKHAEQEMQKALDSISKWCAKWRIGLSAEKTKVVVFTRCPTHKRTPLNLTLSNNLLQTHDEADFLGVRFNSYLTWEPQIRNLINKAQPRINLLRAIRGFSNTVSPQMILDLYKSIVRPIFEYSAIAHITAADCHNSKLQTLQNTIIRCALHIPSYISTETLHDASGLPILHDHLVSFAKKRLDTMKVNSPIISDVIQEFEQINIRTKHKSPLEFIYS